MKTVMKKMFSLLLVAVLLVSAVPFAAFAAEEKTTAYDLSLEPGTYSVDALLTAQGYTGSSTNYWVHCHAPAEDYVAGASFEAVADRAYTLYVVDTVADAEPATVTCSTCGETYTEGTTHTCPTLTCDKCGDSYTKGTTHTCPTCSAISGCVLSKNHSGEHQCACGLYPQKGSAHNSNCPFDEDVITTPSDSYTVHVWGNLITGETKTERIWLGKIENVSGTALVRDVIGANKEYLLGQIAWKAPGYEWSTNYYAENSSGKLIEIGSNTTVEAEDDIIINLYADQKLVVARVHTNKSYHVDMTVQVNGFKVGDVVTYDDVLKAVKKHYNVSSMKIYTYTEWEKVINGKDANKTTNFVVKGDSNDNVYEVYLTGSVKSSSSSSSATADSSNPKTGDMIFAPVAVMGLSVSALAVLFFLNKKRAY